MVSVAPRTDWLFGHQTDYCDWRVDYSNSTLPMDLPARLTMTGLYVCAFVAVLLMPQRREELLPSAEGVGSEMTSLNAGGSAKGPTAKRERWVVLDTIRISCVVGVICEHSGGSALSEHNHGFVTEFVLQWLFIVSGIAFTMSRANFGTYFLRYAAVFAVGCVCNMIGDAIARPGWYNDLGNTIFRTRHAAKANAPRPARQKISILPTPAGWLGLAAGARLPACGAPCL